MKSSIQKRQEELEKINHHVVHALMFIEELKAKLAVERLQERIEEMESKREA